jgi:hypothetical protein
MKKNFKEKEKIIYGNKYKILIGLKKIRNRHILILFSEILSLYIIRFLSLFHMDTIFFMNFIFIKCVNIMLTLINYTYYQTKKP